MDFDPGCLTDTNDIDLKMHIWAYKKTRALFLSTQFCTGEPEFVRPQFPEGSEAAGSAPNPTYTAEDDKAIEKFIRENLGTPWHSIGTAKMAPFEQNGVVDSNLNVYGVQGLKCVDLSIAPQMVSVFAHKPLPKTQYDDYDRTSETIVDCTLTLGQVSANTNNTAYVVGEKGADIIMRELGILKASEHERDAERGS